MSLISIHYQCKKIHYQLIRNHHWHDILGIVKVNKLTIHDSL